MQHNKDHNTHQNKGSSKTKMTPWQTQLLNLVRTSCSGQIAIALLMTIAIAGLFSCNPSEKEVDLPRAISASALKYKITQNPDKDNMVYLESETSQVIPFWDFGSGTSTKKMDTIIFPFSGDYTIHYSVSAGGGFVPGDSTTIHVTNTDLDYLTDPSWGYIAGATGKTWVLDMSKPIGWYGLDYAKHNGSAEDWSWHPDYAGNEWVMPDRDYGSMHFDLNNGKNYTLTMIDANGKSSTRTGNFDLNPEEFSMKLIGAELLYGGDYHSQATNWKRIELLELSDTSITLGVLRDNPNPPDGVCYIGYTFKLKE